MTNIGWTHMPGYRGETWDVIEGCTRKSAGCAHCWAVRQVNRFAGNPALRAVYGGLVERQANGLLDWTGEVREMRARLSQPLGWRKPRMVFVASRGDLFHERVREVFVAEVFSRMANTPRHLYLVLTKRPDRMRELLPGLWRKHRAFAEIPFPPPNVWLGVSVEDQRTADERIPALLNTPAAHHFVSYEPALGPIFWQRAWTGVPGLDWIIYGGESEPGGSFHLDDPAWARDTRDFCIEHRIAFYFKQQAGRRPGTTPWLTEEDGMRWLWRQWPGMLALPNRVLSIDEVHEPIAAMS